MNGLKILTFMTEETQVSKKRILILASISGIANSLLLVILNEAATVLQNGEMELQLFAQYFLTFLLFIFAQRTAQKEAVTAVEYALQNVRVRLANKVRQADLRTVESLGDIGSYSSLTQGANTIAQSVMYMITGVESLMVLIFANLYLLWLSPSSFMVAIVLIIITITLLVRHYQKTFDELSEASQKEGQFFAQFTSMLSGFKQLKMSRKESDEMFNHVETVATETSRLKSRSNVRLLEDILLTNVTFYLLLMLVVFVLPTFITAHEENLFQVIATILFMMEPVYSISSALPNVSKTNVAISGLYRLESHLDSQSIVPNTASRVNADDVESIQLNQVIFRYKNVKKKALFQTGPLNLTINKGEVTFITGGNGSGKSTLLKLLTGLYPLDQGNIELNTQQLAAEDFQNYRELFSVVFNDFHLFKRLYGLNENSEALINEWLAIMELEHQTAFLDGGFTNTDLSTGQRKRLAFIAAIIQQRPILILDELAADQDAAFRKRFYQEIIPKLKAEGKTIIAVTHDEMYFDVADHLLQMDAGKLSRYVQ